MNLLFAVVFGIGLIIVFLVAGVWLLAALVRGGVRLLFGPGNPPSRNSFAAQQRTVLLCSRTDCLTQNPTHAQYCRKCGQRLSGAQVRRVA